MSCLREMKIYLKRILTSRLWFLLLILFAFYSFITINFIKISQSTFKLDSQISKILNQLADVGYDNFDKFHEINNLLKIKDIYRSLPMIYVVTPTFARATQFAELNRLQNTLRLVPRVYWMVIEDSKNKSDDLGEFLKSSGLVYQHLNIHYNYNTSKFYNMKTGQQWKLQGTIHRGSRQRNHAISWFRNNTQMIKSNSVVYFGDDDNSYNTKLFQEMRYTNKMSIWPVAFCGGVMYEKPVAVNKKVVDWFFIDYFISNKSRKFPTDMASFAVNFDLLMHRPKALFPDTSVGACYESTFIQELVEVADLEGKADDCKKLLVWHIRTLKNITTKVSIGVDFIQKGLESLYTKR